MSRTLRMIGSISRLYHVESDTGNVLVNIQLPDFASLERTALVTVHESAARRITPTLTLPHQGGGKKKALATSSPSPLVGEGGGGGKCCRILHGDIVTEAVGKIALEPHDADGKILVNHHQSDPIAPGIRFRVSLRGGVWEGCYETKSEIRNPKSAAI